MTIAAQPATPETVPLNQAASAQRYLILQGLASPFFKELALLLSKDGCPVHKVNFCGGDWWFSGACINHRFNGTLEQLTPFYRTLIERHGITTLILFGDCRPIHKAARALCQKLGLTLWVFEEGYTRPGFITCEQNGTNDLSNLPRDPAGVRARADALKETATPQPPSQQTNPMPRRVRMDLTYHLWNILLKPFYFRYRSHRPSSVLTELKGWAARLGRKAKFKRVNSRLVARYENPETEILGNEEAGNENPETKKPENLGKPYFFVPLQLSSDYQIREHSNYNSCLEFIAETLASFAKNAPKDARLMFKAHPLDNGLVDYRSYIAMAAARHSLNGRVDYIEGGDLNIFLKRCCGVILINSTVGYAALKASKPMKVLGRAIYDMEGLSSQTPLDTFWGNVWDSAQNTGQNTAPDTAADSRRQTAPLPDTDLITRFLKVVRCDSQISGDFFTRSGIQLAAKAAAHRIETHTHLPLNKETHPL